MEKKEKEAQSCCFCHLDGWKEEEGEKHLKGSAFLCWSHPSFFFYFLVFPFEWVGSRPEFADLFHGLRSREGKGKRGQISSWGLIQTRKEGKNSHTPRKLHQCLNSEHHHHLRLVPPFKTLAVSLSFSFFFLELVG